MDKKQGWFKPYILNPHNIEKLVWEGKPGVYVLANMEANDKVKVKQIKMSANVKEDLKKNLGKFHVFMYKPLKNSFNTYAKPQQTLQFV